MQNDERRQNERKEYTEYWIDVSISSDNIEANKEIPSALISVKIENLSPSGACFISQDPFELDQLVHFHGKDTNNKVGKVIWTCQNKIECKTGVHFI